MSLTNVEIFFWHGRDQKLVDRLLKVFPEIEQRPDEVFGHVYFFRRIDLNSFAKDWKDKFIFIPDGGIQEQGLLCVTHKGTFGQYG